MTVTSPQVLQLSVQQLRPGCVQLVFSGVSQQQISRHSEGSRRRNSLERCPRPLYPQEENPNIPEDHQGEDLIDIKVEVIDEAEETMDLWADQQDGSRRRNPPERCPRPLYPQDCLEENHNIPEDHQREDLTNIKVEEDIEEALRGGQPCRNVVKDENPDVFTEAQMSSPIDIARPTRHRQNIESFSPFEGLPYAMDSPTPPARFTVGEKETSRPSQRHRGARRGRRRVSRGSTRGDEEYKGPDIDNELLIQLVEARAPLWDSMDPRHADYVHTRRLWEKIYRTIDTRWGELTPEQRRRSGEKILIRWRSIRDRYMRDLREERSGSAPCRRPLYCYREMLRFLDRCADLRLTTSGSRPPEVPHVVVPEEEDRAGPSVPHTHAQAPIVPHVVVPEEEARAGPSVPRSQGPIVLNVVVPEEEARAGPSVPHTRSRAPERQIPESALSRTNRSAMYNVSEPLLRRERSGRRHLEVLDDLTRITREAMMGLEEQNLSVREELNRLLDGVGTSLPPSRNIPYLISLSPWMDLMPPEHQDECRLKLLSTVLEFLQRPPSQSYPQSESYTPSHSNHQFHTPSHHESQLHTPSHSYPQSYNYPQSHPPSQSYPQSHPPSQSYPQSHPPSQSYPR
ncbi:uncharacterized protein LOC143793545 isoform X2 [Ranitomeya variabilis]|uniref:uncharacterized protein LOC143793545 isoform X2 n=1 Tax=Ranitomeya variabilis TaxID=490064 RepID=UPI0040567A81